MAAALDGADAVIFTAGIGEHAWRARRSGPRGNGMDGDPFRAEANRANARSSAPSARKRAVFIIPTDEERIIAEHTVATAANASPRRESGRGER